MVMDNSFEPCDFVLFGTLGDLSRRKLLPSLYQLEKAELIHPDTKIIGVARQDLSTEDYKKEVRNNIEKFGSKQVCEDTWARLEARLQYACVDMKNTESYRVFDSVVDADRIMVCYLATPPAIYGDICRGLHSCDIIDSSVRVVLEKPIGHDLESSRALMTRFQNTLKNRKSTALTIIWVKKRFLT